MRPERLSKELRAATVCLAGRLLNPTSGKELAQAREMAYTLHNMALEVERETMRLLRESNQV